MKIRKKIILAAAGAGVLAATASGAAQAAADKPQAAAVTAVAAKPLAAAAPAKPEVATAFLNVKIGAATVVRGGKLKVTVGSSECITDVIAWAYPANGFGGAASGKSTKKATAFTLYIPFSSSKPLGTWFLTDVDATICGTKAAGWNANWNGAAKFTLKK